MDQARDAVPQDGVHDDGQDNKVVAAVTGGAPVVLTLLPQTASARLRAAREALGLTTTDIAARTRITIRHVEALARGDLAALPGRPYVLGFVRNYARAVGLDGAELATLARSEMDASVPRPAPRMVHQFDVDDPAKTPSALVTWAALGLVIAALVAGGVFWRSYYSPGATLPSLVAPDPTPAPIARPVNSGPSGPTSGSPTVSPVAPAPLATPAAASAPAPIAPGAQAGGAIAARPHHRSHKTVTDDSATPEATPAPAPAAIPNAPAPAAASATATPATTQ